MLVYVRAHLILLRSACAHNFSFFIRHYTMHVNLFHQAVAMPVADSRRAVTAAQAVADTVVEAR